MGRNQASWGLVCGIRMKNEIWRETVVTKNILPTHFKQLSKKGESFNLITILGMLVDRAFDVRRNRALGDSIHKKYCTVLYYFH